MRRVWLCAAILAVIIISCAVSTIVVEKKCSELTEKIVAAQELYNSGSKEEAVKRMDGIYDDWEWACRYFSCVMEKERLFELNASIARIKPFMESDNDELSAEFRSVIFQLELIGNSEMPYIWNVL